MNSARGSESARSENSVDIIVPSYGEHAVVALCVKRIFDSFKNTDFEYTVIVVLDGPDEEALVALTELNSNRVKVIQFETNHGKGAALRSGIQISEARFIAFIDADLDIHPDAIRAGLDVLLSNNMVVGAYGSKVHPESDVTYPASRRIMSFVFRLFLRAVLQLNITDSQTGLKVFRSAELKEVLDESREDGYLFDLEIMMLLSRRNHDLRPVPITLDYQFNSSIKVSTALKIARQGFALRRKVR